MTHDIFHRTIQIVIQFIWNHKRPQIDKAILRKKKQAEGITLPDIRQYYKAIAIKKVWYWHKKQTYGSTEQNRETRNKPNSNGQLSFNRGDKNTQQRKDSFFRKWCWETGSVQFSHSVVSDSLQPHESQHTRPPCPTPWPTPGVYSNSCPSSQWCHPAISSSVVPFSSCPQSLLASGSFPMSQLFTWGGQSIGVSASASVLPMNT